MGDTRKEELDFLDWTKKITERVNTVHVCLSDKRKILETDYDVMQALHSLWYNGTLPLYKYVADLTDNGCSQQDLFCSDVSTTEIKTDNSAEKAK